MASFLHTGVPGSGKTYLMVEKFCRLFCDYDKETERFILKEKFKDKILVSNIEGLTLQHIDLETMLHERCLTLARKKFIDNLADQDLETMDDVIDEYYADFKEEKIRWFFNMPFQKSLQEKHGGIIYLIEESQRYFDGKELGRQKWVRDVFYFFEKHRHVGCSIFMDTQHISKLVKGISVLFETETRAKPRTFSIMGEFKYNEYSEGAKMNQVPIVKKPDQRIFKTYKSMSAAEDVKTKKPIFKLLSFVGVMVVMAFFVLGYAKSNLGPKSAHAKTPVKTNVSNFVPADPVRPGASQETKQDFHWERLSFIKSTKGFSVVHPITNVILDLKELDLEVRRQGTSLLVKIPDQY